MTRLERIVVQAFRGYPSRAEVVLSGDVVLLAGENGTGKTSLTEAFEWALFAGVLGCSWGLGPQRDRSHRTKWTANGPQRPRSVPRPRPSRRVRAELLATLMIRCDFWLRSLREFGPAEERPAGDCSEARS